MESQDARTPGHGELSGAAAVSDRSRERALVRLLVGQTPDPQAAPDRVAVVGRLADVTLADEGDDGLALRVRRAGEAALPPRSLTHPALRGYRTRARDGGSTCLMLGIGRTRILVLQAAGFGGLDGQVRHVATFVGASPSARLHLAAPALWGSPEASAVLAAAVATSTDRVTVAGATFDLRTADGIGAWRLFARVCPPHPSAYANGTGAR